MHTHKFANVYESYSGYIDKQQSVNKTDYIFEIKLCGEKKKLPLCFSLRPATPPPS